MRRGHPGLGAGGWRGDNPRSFRPRGAGPPNFRPSRPFGPPDCPRFPPPGLRQYRGSGPYPQHPGRQDDVQEHQERNKYRINNIRPSGYHNQGRQMPPYHHQARQNDDHGDYSEPNYYQNSNQCHVNSMGDIDHRRQRPSPWSKPPPNYDNSRPYHEDHRSPHKTPRHYNLNDDLPDYSGHRPPASDHYSSTSGPNSSQYSHSVDDTVDIVRKRLQNRDKQQSSDTSEHQSNADEDLRKNSQNNFTNRSRGQPARKRMARQKQNVNSNSCDQIKTKIVNQLFKMDKTKIHKLMDDPSSSSKFEFAISSLITEGQNSLNRHLRAAAEKSLTSSSSDFIQSDTNTIYEDTFMKQMQGVLDPQDTVLLEDIKPVIMAELSKALQLDDYQAELMQEIYSQNQAMDYEDDQQYHNDNHESSASNQYYNDFDQFNHDTQYEQNQMAERRWYHNPEHTGDSDNVNYEYEQESSFEEKPLFQRRPASRMDSDLRKSVDRRRSRNSLEMNSDTGIEKSERQSEYQKKQLSKQDKPVPLFDANADQISDDDDTFAEFDKQYHVAVDHNFMQYSSRPGSPSQSLKSLSDKSSTHSVHNAHIDAVNTKTSQDVKKETNAHFQNISQSPLHSSIDLLGLQELEIKSEMEIKEEVSEKENLLTTSSKNNDCSSVALDESSKKKESRKEPEKRESSTSGKSVLQPNTRKRSTDQKPSHRKEKRKKSSGTECREAAQSIISMFYSHHDSKDTNKTSKDSNSSEKNYSDKYVKRKEPSKSNKEKDSETPKSDNSKKHSSNHSAVSPKNASETPPKSDSKTKLKPIDIFEAQPKKPSTHQAHRNTALVQTTLQVLKSPDDKPKPIIPVVTSFARKLSKRHIGTQVGFKVKTKETQTNRKKTISSESQTEPVEIKSRNVSTNPLERMKEIDMEIQVLLQEKFKLYNSLEKKSADMPMDTIPNLSMRVFKVNEQVEEQNLDDRSADAIANDFTNIPTEELESIAMETAVASPVPKRNKRQKVLAVTRKNSASPTAKRKNKRAKTPNISLIEQIITDDRPIEDIISLDALESSPAKVKAKKKKSLPKKKTSKQAKPINMSSFNIRECSVVLRRFDMDKYLRAKTVTTSTIDCEDSVELLEIRKSPVVVTDDNITPVTHVPSVVDVVEEVVNDLQFDMLDVSEDIVIGDVCEVKSTDKEKGTITEEIILDNSQSSVEDVVPEATPENECKMFDYSNENLRRDAITVTGNADAVLAIECIDGEFLAACLDGNVYHFSGDGQLLNTLRGTNQAITCLSVVKEKYGTTVYTGSLDSRMRYYDLESGLEKGPECNVLSPIQTMDLKWGTIFVGTRTGFVLQFECKNNMVIPVSTVKFSEQSILALRAMKEGPRKVLLVAARSESVVTVKDAQTGLLLRTLQGPKMTVYTLLYEDGKVYCGTSSHNIHIFDYTSGAHVGSHEGGKGAVCLRASGSLVFAGCYDGCVYVFREGEARPLAQLRGPGLMLLSLAIHGTKIIAGYKDRGLYIWKLPQAIVQEMIL